MAHTNYLSIALEKRDVDSKEFLRFLKRSSRAYFRDAEYWQSPLPSIHLGAVLDSDLQADFWNAMFSDAAHANTSLLTLLAQGHLEQFVRYFKLNYTHRIPAFRTVLPQIAARAMALQHYVAEIEFFANYEEELISRRKQRDTYFLQFLPDEVIMGFLLLHQEIKVTDRVLNNEAERTSMEVAIFKEITRILKLFAERGGEAVTQMYYKDQKEFAREWHYFAAKRMHEPEPELQVPVPNKLDLLLRMARESHSDEYAFSDVGRFFAGFLALQFLPDKKVKIVENKANQQFEYDNRKAGQVDKYFLNRHTSFKRLLSGMIENQDGGLSSMMDGTLHLEHFAAMGEPTTLQWNGKQISLERCLSLLQVLARFIGPEQRHYATAKGTGKTVGTVLNLGTEKLVKFFGKNYSMSIFDFDTFKQKVASFFGWREEDAAGIVDFLTWDLSTNPPIEMWLERPFLKIGDKLLWVGAMHMHRNWVIGLQTRMRSREFPPQFVNELSAGFEMAIAKLFEAAGFNVLVGKRFTNSAGASGDYDVVAFKGKHLFIIEAKNALVQEGFVESTYVELTRLQSKAAYQLDKCMEAATEGLPDLLRDLGMEEDVPTLAGEVTVYPFIVTRAFEGDQVYYRGYPKVSIIELEVILNNGLDDLYGVGMMSHQAFHGFTNAFNPHYRGGEMPAGKRDLWDGQAEITGETLIRCIEEERVWQEFYRTWDFS